MSSFSNSADQNNAEERESSIRSGSTLPSQASGNPSATSMREIKTILRGIADHNPNECKLDSFTSTGRCDISSYLTSNLQAGQPLVIKNFSSFTEEQRAAFRVDQRGRHIPQEPFAIPIKDVERARDFKDALMHILASGNEKHGND